MLGLIDYTVYRRDREGIGGGILVAIRNDIKSEMSDELTTSEILTIKCVINKNPINLIACYLPHSTINQSVKLFFEELYSITSKLKNYIIFGDFNMSEIDWKNNTFPDTYNYQLFKKFYINSQPLHQLNLNNTRKDKILDLIFTDNELLINKIFATSPVLNSDHCALLAYTNITTKNKKKTIIYKKSFDNVDYNNINNELLFRFQKFYLISQAEIAYINFNKIITHIITSFIPNRKYILKENKIFDEYSNKLYNRRKRLFLKFKNKPSLNNFLTFSQTYKFFKIFKIY